MRLKKCVRFVALLVGLFIVFSLKIEAKATSSNIKDVSNLSEKQVNEILLKKGTPLNVIESMKLTLKREIASSEGTYESSDIKIANMTNQQPTTEDGISPMGNIPASQLGLSFYVYRVDAYNVQVWFGYDWADNYLPVMRLYDPFGIAWDSSKFNHVVESKHIDYYSTPNTLTNIQFSEENRSADVGAGFIYWNADLKSSVVTTVYDLWGNGYVKLRSSSPYQTCQIYGRYSHVTGSGTYGLALWGTSLSWSGSAGHDDAAITGSIQ